MRSGWVEALALAAPVITAVLVVRISTQSALALAREERSEAARKDAYVMLADHVVRVRQLALVLNPDLTDDHPLMPPWPNDDERYRMFAHVEVFGSDAVRDVFDDVLTQTARARTWVGELTTAKSMSPPYSDADRDYRVKALEESTAAKKRLLELCRDALALLNAEMARGGASRRRMWPWSKAREQSKSG